MTALDAHRIVDRWQRLKHDRSTHECVWQEIAEFLRPLRAEFLSGARAHPGARRDQKVFDSTPIIAADNFTGGIYAMMTNPANRWFALKLEDEDLDDYAPARDLALRRRNAPARLLRAADQPLLQRHPRALRRSRLFRHRGVFERRGVRRASWRILDRTHALAEVCIAENALGDVDTVYRRFTVEARNAAQLFGDRLSRDARKRPRPTNRSRRSTSSTPSNRQRKRARASVRVHLRRGRRARRGGRGRLRRDALSRAALDAGLAAKSTAGASANRCSPT